MPLAQKIYDNAPHRYDNMFQMEDTHDLVQNFNQGDEGTLTFAVDVMGSWDAENVLCVCDLKIELGFTSSMISLSTLPDYRDLECTYVGTLPNDFRMHLPPSFPPPPYSIAPRRPTKHIGAMPNIIDKWRSQPNSANNGNDNNNGLPGLALAHELFAALEKQGYGNESESENENDKNDNNGTSITVDPVPSMPSVEKPEQQQPPENDKNNCDNSSNTNGTASLSM